MSMRALLSRSALVAAAFCAGLALPAAAQQIGTVASSEPTLRGTPPGATTRTLSIGTGVVSDETVASSASGRGQLLFLDQTTLSLAPNTTIVLDRFVFDPSSGGGEMGLRLTEGALRFIGGTLSRDGEATVTTPGATIGIRGSSALISHLNGQTVAIFLAGDQMCVIVAGQRRCTSRQGGVLTPEGYAGQVNPDFLARLLELIDGPPLPGGGASPDTGIGTSSPSNGDASSPDGERFDNGLFDDDFGAEFDALGLMPGFGEEKGEEEYEECFFDADGNYICYPGQF